MIKLSDTAKEIAGFYAKYLNQRTESFTEAGGSASESTEQADEVFARNFFSGFRESLTSEQRDIVTDLEKCNFQNIQAFYKEQKVEDKLKKNKEASRNSSVVTIDGRECIVNMNIEPPGLFRGINETHKLRGSVKKRIAPGDVVINCSEDSIPVAPDGSSWKEVRHDNTVSWLASWTENVTKKKKYMRFSSNEDFEKFERNEKFNRVNNVTILSFSKNYDSSQITS